MKRSRLRQVMLVVTLVTGAALPIAWWTIAGPHARLRLADEDETSARRVMARSARPPTQNSAGVGMGSEFGASGRGRDASVAGANQMFIDGRVNPERISDATAAAMLLPMLAPSPMGAAGHEKRRRIMLKDAGFDEQDLHVLQEVLAPLHELIDERRRQANAAHEASKTDPTSADASRPRPAPPGVEAPAAPAAAAFARLQRELSPDGVIRLRQQLAHIKSNTKVYPLMTGESWRSR